jgi:hypothetical protein
MIARSAVLPPLMPRLSFAFAAPTCAVPLLFSALLHSRTSTCCVFGFSLRVQLLAVNGLLVPVKLSGSGKGNDKSIVHFYVLAV